MREHEHSQRLRVHDATGVGHERVALGESVKLALVRLDGRLEGFVFLLRVFEGLDQLRQFAFASLGLGLQHAGFVQGLFDRLDLGGVGESEPREKVRCRSVARLGLATLGLPPHLGLKCAVAGKENAVIESVRVFPGARFPSVESCFEFLGNRHPYLFPGSLAPVAIDHVCGGGSPCPAICPAG